MNVGLRKIESLATLSWFDPDRQSDSLILRQSPADTPYELLSRCTGPDLNTKY